MTVILSEHTLAKSRVCMLVLHGKMTRGKLTAMDITKPSFTASLKIVGRKFIRISPDIGSSQNAT